jgi:hypothetical protein
MVCTDRSDHVHIPRAAHTGHFSAEGFRNLYCERSDASRRTDDQDLLPWLNLSRIAKTVEGGESRGRYGSGLLKRGARRFQHELVFSSTSILGAGAVARAEYLIPWLKLLYVSANRLNVPCHIRSHNIVPWFEQPDPRAHEVRNASHDAPVTCMQGSCVNAYQHIIVLDHRLVDLLEF